ncbi:hypothetical protein GCM10027055_17830 [Janibacter alkaliphilus]|uniref:MT0933-like antitoxin protein n=1 Tax=Janibacter alkaliphilus TaxID=1069963 RepID=A0A852WZT3_9MICO|nr:antitoxin [Janibacter alkaliphilus]NYG35767.1 hypothetical protein [Janibacter alkaliphilus]
MRFKKAAALFGAAEMARSWVRKNPDAARRYIDKASSTVDKRTGGKYSSKITGASDAAKKAVAKESGTSQASSATVPGSTTGGQGTGGQGTGGQGTGTTPPPPGQSSTS